MDLTGHSENDDQNAKDEKLNENKRRKAASLKISRTDSIDATRSCEDENQKSFEEKNALIELESSSKGKIKGSILLHYLKSSNIPGVTSILCALFAITQMFASVADVWVPYW